MIVKIEIEYDLTGFHDKTFITKASGPWWLAGCIRILHTDLVVFKRKRSGVMHVYNALTTEEKEHYDIYPLTGDSM